MMHKGKRRACALVVGLHGIHDPLMSTLMLDYVLRLQERGTDLDILLVTEEPGPTTLDPAWAARLERARITWKPLRYDVRGAQFPQRIRNIARLAWWSWRFTRGYAKRTAVGFLSMAGAYAALVRPFGFQRLVLVNFEPHSRYMREMGLWSEGSLKHRVVRWSEGMELRRADAVVAPSTAVQELVRARHPGVELHLQGVTVDVRANARDEAAGAEVRRRYGLEGRTVVLYIGKFGGIYYSEAAYVRFMQTTCAADPAVHHLIVTHHEHMEQLRRAPGWDRVQDRTTLLGPMPPEALRPYLSAADLGVIAVPPTPSQRFRSPVKTALYWAAGVPILIPEGVSDDWWIAREQGIGIVVDDLPTMNGEALRTGLDHLRAGGVDVLRKRCVEAAMRLRDTGHMVDLLERLVQGKGRPTAP
ncbi:MAG: hypothetical protein IT228_03060 [Flavobacteriales bacterium]|nr:hypothetical protein [Flavobacteriales bacterium]NUQ15265.1 hypothetical protein [Flavobacteriales bacterium]